MSELSAFLANIGSTFSVMINTKWLSMVRTTTEDCFSIKMFDCFIREYQFF